MANLKISELPIATPLQGAELFPIVQGGVTKQATLNQFHNYVVSTEVILTPNVDVNLSDAAFDNVLLVKLIFNGGGGGSEHTNVNLPDATTNLNRIIRFVSDSGFSNNTQARITPINGQNLDGQTTYYTINTNYEGLMVWSDGAQWVIIQKKA